MIANGKLDDPETAASLLMSGAADVVALGKAALGNRDWPHQVRNNVPFAELDLSLVAPSPTSRTGNWNCPPRGPAGFAQGGTRAARAAAGRNRAG